jgi:hypothetical protein
MSFEIIRQNAEFITERRSSQCNSGQYVQIVVIFPAAKLAMCSLPEVARPSYLTTYVAWCDDLLFPVTERQTSA